eukprot:CAMPEP_0203749480 /NCGR_PEP_ID=MMETSP0098-20131031/4033_1 /ASSEMBLY_ACC=CAM_ASM_000208 /TAXON_ID=96639 /ORGANISM=" , Strain NY0313808BC1" /LENGTH=397 /DNA_ID=CAMNT_0050638549 /DNA_START=355 /DNA_END=1548 /DNA_ORIENTATION=+
MTIVKTLTFGAMHNETTTLEECVFDGSGCVSYKLILLSFLFWGIGLHVLKYLFIKVCEYLLGEVDADHAYLPDVFPVEEKAGKSEEWMNKVSTCGEKVLDGFLAFRGKGDEVSLSLEVKRELVAREAVAYNNEVYDRKLGWYITEKFTNKKRVAFPVKPRPWNGWRGWMAELGPEDRAGISGVFVYMLEHGLAGFLALYSLHYDDRFVRVVSYVDMGFNLADLVFMTASLFIGYDCSIYMGPKRMGKGDTNPSGIFKMLAFHHLGAAVLEFMQLKVDSDHTLCAEIAICLLGTTGLLHCASVLSNSLPIRDNKPVFFGFTAFTFAAMVWYRLLMWPFIVYSSLVETYARGGASATVGALLFLALFTLFNIDFLKFYWHKTKMAYKMYAKKPEAKKLN